jgi:hypothetical protein
MISVPRLNRRQNSVFNLAGFLSGPGMTVAMSDIKRGDETSWMSNWKGGAELLFCLHRRRIKVQVDPLWTAYIRQGYWALKLLLCKFYLIIQFNSFG